MARPKATVRRIPQVSIQRIGNKNILNRQIRNGLYKIKKVLPQSKALEVKQNVRVIRGMPERRKSFWKKKSAVLICIKDSSSLNM